MGVEATNMSRRVRCLQIGTAAIALFAVLGACGAAPAGRRPRTIVRPRPARAEVTIRSLTGTWEAAGQRSGGDDALTLVLVQSGDTVAGTLTVGGRTLASDPAAPARLDAHGRFAIALGRTHERLVVGGRPDATADTIFASVSGLAPQPVLVTFRRR
jgi:hypothetical protein